MNYKKQDELINNIQKSLYDLNCVTLKNGSILKNRIYFIPNSEDINRVIEKIRAELLEDGTISEEVIILVNLLYKSNQLKQYFSKYESEKLKIRLKQIKENNVNDMINKVINCTQEIMVTITLLMSML